MHIVNLIDPLLCWMMWGVSAARDIIDKKRLSWIYFLHLLHPLNILVSHCGCKIPVRIPDIGVDRSCVPEEIRLPLARITAYKTVEVLKAHTTRPLVERANLTR